MINLLLISEAAYMDWMSAIIAILALLVMILIGWQIWNYVYFEKKLDDKIASKLNEVEKKFRKEQEEQIAISNYYSYLKSAASHQDSFGWHPHIVLNNLAQAIEEIIKIKDCDISVLTPLIDHIEELCKFNNVFGSEYEVYAEGVDSFIPKLKLLLGKDEKIYDLLKEIEKQRDNRKELIKE